MHTGPAALRLAGVQGTAPPRGPPPLRHAGLKCAMRGSETVQVRLCTSALYSPHSF